MLSNPTSCLQQRQKLHRRQNSTPVAFEGAKVPNLPVTASALTRRNSHRRGLSLDQRSPTRQHRQPTEDPNRTNYTNLGHDEFQQHILRETQQQRLARPGQQQYSNPLINSPGTQCGPIQEHSFQQQYNDTNGLYLNTNLMNTVPQISGNQQHGNAQEHTPNHSFDMAAAAGYFDGYGLGLDQLTGSQQEAFESTQPLMIQSQENFMENHARRLSQQSNQYARYQRPSTPVQQISSSHFPLTPATTPFRKSAELAHGIRTAASSPTKRHRDESIKQMHSLGMQRGRSLQGIFEHGMPHGANIPSPPKTAPLTTSTFDLAVMPSSPLDDVSAFDGGYLAAHHSPAGQPISPHMSSFASSPQVDSLPVFDSSGLEMCSQTSLPSSSNPLILSGSTSPIKAPSSPKGMSISDLNLTPDVDATKVETGVTMDDIETYMEGPDLADNKFICRFADCNKRFGRRENIKSHIQTHLNDRQYQCLHCGSKFVRGHDLKRHAKTHEGKKPFVCLCGNGFGRPDALTRHRQRNMCIGAIDGIVKKEVRRGRPPKYRDALEARKEKVRRTKERNRANAAHAHTLSQASMATFPSSASVSSDSDYHSQSPPPSTLMDNLSIADHSSPYDDLNVTIRDSSPMMGEHGMHMGGGDSFGFPPDVFTFTPPTSPGYSTGNKPSPLRSHSNSFSLEHLQAQAQAHSQSEHLPALTAPATSIPGIDIFSPHHISPEPMLPPSSPPEYMGDGSAASSPFTDEEMDAFLEMVDQGVGGSDALYSDEFFTSEVGGFGE